MSPDLFIWAASWQNQQNGRCAQRRLRSAWASAQSDQSLCCPYKERLGPLLPIDCTAKTLIRLGGCPCWSEFSLGAHAILLVLSSSSSSSYPFWSPVFLYRGLGFLTSLSRRRPLHSERFWGSAESIPSFFLSFSSTSSHDFLGLPDLFCATTFSLRTSAIQPVLHSTCPNHLIILVWSTTSKSWMPSFVRRESELTSSFALTLQAAHILSTL